MSYHSSFVCDLCKHSIVIGFVDAPTDRTTAFCRGCDREFRVIASEGENLLETDLPHRLFDRGRKWVEVSSKKGRVKKTIATDGWIDTGIFIPVGERLLEIGETLYIQRCLNFESIVCPHCDRLDAIVDYWDYVEQCPNCRGGRMRERCM